ncbi:MAG: hypothetical protein CM1200mP14_03260 [Gammaproteobacteria bacterium]|nr:MAG: hypothetical protein CM1200mP14_03260 [Gammaproteobacteria bacterium]
MFISRERAIGSGASGGNAGTVAVGHPPLNRRGRLRQIVLSLLDEGSPLYIPPRWDPSLWKWLRTSLVIVRMSM